MAAGGAAAAAAAIAMAIKASGVLVRLEPSEFMKVLNHVPDPLIVTWRGGVFTKRSQYLVGYKGLGFFTQSAEPLDLPANVEIIVAKKGIWVPG